MSSMPTTATQTALHPAVRCRPETNPNESTAMHRKWLRVRTRGAASSCSRTFQLFCYATKVKEAIKVVVTRCSISYYYYFDDEYSVSLPTEILCSTRV